jgi:putative PEP-CTERM system histidine kinase
VVESPGGALWLRHDTLSFRQSTRLKFPRIDNPEPSGDPLAKQLQEREWIVNLTADQLDGSTHIQLPAWLTNEPRAWLVVPLLAANDLVGFVVLAHPRAAIEVNWETRDLLKSIARQAASYLVQIRASDALLEASKFDAFNKMSAFIVHDLKNLAAQLSLMLSNVERHGENPEFRADMLLTVKHVADRMMALLTQLRTTATPVSNPTRVNLAAIVMRVVDFRGKKTPQVLVEGPDQIYVLGHAERLERVVNNLIQNAQDATNNANPIIVRLKIDGSFVTLDVADKGAGMSEAFIRDQLFKPFQSTKSAGMGIGAYESAQYVRELGGQIEVHSVETEGTTMRVFLPNPDSLTVTTKTSELPQQPMERA